MSQIYSPVWELVKADLKKVGVGLLVALGGALATFLTDVTGLIDFSHYGPTWGPIIMLAFSSLSSSFVNLIRKWLSTTVYTKPNINL